MFKKRHFYLENLFLKVFHRFFYSCKIIVRGFEKEFKEELYIA